MTLLIRSELHKLMSVTWFKVTVIATVALSSVSAITNVLQSSNGGGPALGSTANIHHVLSSSALTSMVMLAIGIAMAANEYRHNTSVPTFLVTPRRRDVVAAKLLTATAIGAVLGGVAFGCAVAAAVPTLGSKGVDHLAGDSVEMLLGAVVASALYGALGVALGFITRSVVGAMVAALLFVQLVEQAFLDSVFPQLGRWLPTGANLAITHTATNPRDLLTPAAAAFVLLAWAVVLAAGAARIAVDRDV